MGSRWVRSIQSWRHCVLTRWGALTVRWAYESSLYAGTSRPTPHQALPIVKRSAGLGILSPSPRKRWDGQSERSLQSNGEKSVGKICQAGTISRKLCIDVEHMIMIGSSETTREPPLSSFDFTDFVNHHLPSHKREVDTAFLEWLVGFAEGDGCFCYREASPQLPTFTAPPPLLRKSLEGPSLERPRKMRFLFEICQKDPVPLHKVRGGLGFGKVVPSGSGDTLHWRYRVEDRRGLQRIMALFNGNLVLPKLRRQFAAWAGQASAIHHPTFQTQEGGPVVSLSTGWLSGFLDAEGCFYAAFTTPSVRSTLYYGLTQKVSITQQHLCGEREVLAEIGALLMSSARVSVAKPPNCYRIEVSSMESHRILVAYLDRFPLRGKGLIFRRWWRVYLLRAERRHLNETGIRRMRRLCSAIQHGQRGGGGAAPRPPPVAEAKAKEWREWLKI